MAVLYRKYRPKLWSEVYGQDSIKNVLLSEILQDKIANCYIFAGPRGVGKTTIARLMAKSLNCLDRKENGEPCLKCKNCLEFSDSSSNSSLSKNMNVIELDAASNRGVDDTNDFLENVNIPSIGAKYKVFIIDEVHMFSKHSFNRLLKTFEEPPKGVVFILATTEFNKIPDTIISRAEVFKFKKGNKDSLSSNLNAICKGEGVKIDDEVLNTIIAKSSGCFRDAETLLGQVISSGSNDIKFSDVAWLNSGLENLIFDFTLGLINKDLKYLISFISNLSSVDVSYIDFIVELIEFLRKIMIYSIDSSISEEWALSDLHLSKISEFSQKFERDFLVKAIDEFIECKLRMNVFEIKNLALELSVIKICGDDGVMKKNNDMGTHHGASVHMDNLKNNEKSQNKSIPLKNENDVVYEKIDVIDNDVDKIIKYNDNDDNDDMGTHHGASVHMDNLKNNEKFQNKSISLKNENDVVYEKIDVIDNDVDKIIKYDDNNDDNDDMGTHHGASSHDESKSVINEIEKDEFDLDIPDFLDNDDDNNGVGTHHGSSVQEKDDLLNKFKMKKDPDGKLHSEYTTNDDYIDESKMGDEGKSVLDMMKEIL